jgi:hypothetical protein
VFEPTIKSLFAAIRNALTSPIFISLTIRKYERLTGLYKEIGIKKETEKKL